MGIKEQAEQLLKFMHKHCESFTQREFQVLQALAEEDDVQQAAKRLNVVGGTIRSTRLRVDKRAAKMGWAPDAGLSQEAAPGFNVARFTTHYGPDGEVKQQWIQQKPEDLQRLAALKEICDELCERVQGKADPRPGPSVSLADLLNVYVLADCHLGLRTWGAETMDRDFDLEKGTRNLVAAADMLVSTSPAAKQAVVLNVGDMLHSDSNENTTRRSGHHLSVDGRWPKVLRAAVAALRKCIELALGRHETVQVYNLEGNHDDQSAVAIGLVLEAYYSREPRVEVDSSPSLLKRMKWGRTLLGFAHGHTVKLEELPGTMAATWPEMWGETSYRYWLTGHIHQRKVVEKHKCTAESFRTLAPNDAYAAGTHYRSMQDMTRITYHRRWGEHGRGIVPVGQVEPPA